MNIKTIIGLAILNPLTFCYAQGFVNLDFESANVSGYAPGTLIPTTLAIPGWSASFGSASGTNTTSLVYYDNISLGGNMISVVDNNTSTAHLNPLQGNYSVTLFGGGNSVLYSAQISQTGLVPAGTESLLFEALASSTTFVVTLDGQKLSVIPLQTFPNYTLYGADISAFADQTETLSFTEPPAPSGQQGGQPNILELDEIQFLPTAVVPEPDVFGLSVLGAAIFSFRRWRKISK